MELTMSMFATQADYWKARAEQAEKDRDHWKDNHATEIRRARVLKERPDMPLERVEAYEKWGEDLARLSAAEKERDEAIAQSENLRATLDSVRIMAPGLDPSIRCLIASALAAKAPAALSHLRQEIRREALDEAAKECESQPLGTTYQSAANCAEAIRRLAEEAKEQEGKNG